METNLMQLDELFHLENQDLRSYSPLTLAYIGDGIYELIIRTGRATVRSTSFTKKQAVW